MCKKKKKIRVLFQGDSITDAGRNRLSRHSLAGYPRKTAIFLKREMGRGVFDFYNRGISGDRSINLLKRYKRDFLKMRPDIVTIMIGINDVWRKYDRNDPTNPGTYRQNLTTLLQRIKADTGAKIIVMSPYLTPDKKHDEMRADVYQFIEVCKDVALQYADGFINTDVPMNAVVGRCHKNSLSADGVHPGELGQTILARILADKIESII